MTQGKRSWLLAGAALLLPALGCGPSDQVCTLGDTSAPCTGRCAGGVSPCVQKIVVTPDNVLKEVELGSGETHSICYRARAIYSDGSAADITQTALWTTDRLTAGSFSGNCFNTSPMLTAGGIIRIRASVGDGTGDAALIIKLIGGSENDGVTRGLFTGPPNTNPAGKPRVVYPLNDSIHARNFDQMTIQFYAGEGNQVFKARFTSPQADYVITFRPTKCDGDRCQWTVPPGDWARMALTNGGATATFALYGANGADGAPVAQADSLKLSFSPEDVKGALYYFSTSLPGIMRDIFDLKVEPKASPFIIPSSPSNPKDCAGCHAVTYDPRKRDDVRASKITATYGHGDDFLGIASSVDASDFRMRPGTTRSNFQWFNGDGTRLISNFNGELIVRDGETGAEITKVAPDALGPAGRQRAAMPEWSHDSEHIVFVRLLPESGAFYDVATCCGKKEGGDWLLADAGEIVTMVRDGDNFTSPKVVVPQGESKEYHYYPTFSPDDQWILFNTGTKPGFSPIAQDAMDGVYGVPSDRLVSYDQRTSRLRLVRVSGGGIYELGRATVMPGSTASWPKFTPFVQKGGKLMFFTYSSKIDYGFVVTGGKQPQLWMSAIDLSRLGENSEDPSFAPAWMPFQDEREANHLGVWSRYVACGDDNDCPKEFDCEEGRCVSCDIDNPSCQRM